MMEGLSWMPRASGLAALALIISGLVLWFIVRRQKERVWLPVLRVIDLELTVLPKLRWVLPPLWPLLCFFLASLALGLYVFEPTETVIKGETIDLRPTHVIFDLSPSMSLGITSSQYGTAAAELLGSLRANTRMSFSLSSDGVIRSASEIDSVRALINESGFHRAGLKLGSSVDAILRNAPQIEHLIVASDRDQASWEDFNWQYLEKKVQVSWFPLQKNRPALDNIFIDELKPKETVAGAQIQGWTVVLRRSGQGKTLSGTLTVQAEGKTLGTQNWQFEPAAKTVEFDMQINPSSVTASKDEEPLELQWILSAQGPEDLLIDNTFRTWLAVKGQKALLVAKPRGEMFLEDSVFHLRTSLDVLAYRTQRIDKLQPSDASWVKPSLLISEVSPEASRSEFCPSSLLGKGRGNRLQDMQIWLVPSSDLNNFSEICHCFASLAKAPEEIPNRPAYCENLENRDQYVGVLQSLGASQLGGEINSPMGALAMNLKNPALKLRILAFTLPLNPMRKGGVSFGQLPLMVRSLLQFMGAGQSATLDAGQWPRIEDIALNQNDPGLAASNVPLVESLLRQLPFDQLPSELSSGSRGFVRQASMANQELDARPWIMLFLLLIVIALYMEGLGFALGRYFRAKHWAARWFGPLGVILCCCTFSPESGLAQVKMNALGYPQIPNLSQLRREISARTSIDFDENAQQFAGFEKALLREPWLWSFNPRLLDGLEQGEWNQLLGWLQRGGFLIVENHAGGERLKARILEQIPQGAWKPIPPDHELMRSFHLLASLPQCGEWVWEGFHFDQRIAVVLVPGEFFQSLLDAQNQPACFGKFPREQALRVFINLLMVSLATDYKKDQIHLPEILKRLR